MNAENFKNYLNDPSLLYQVPYEELKSLALEYPYNAHLRWLLLEKSRMDHRPDVKKALAKAAVYSIDRRALYRFFQKQYEKTESPLFVFSEDVLELKDLSAIKEELTEPLEETVSPRATPIKAVRETPEPIETGDHEEDLVFDFSPPYPPIDKQEVTTVAETNIEEEVAAPEVEAVEFVAPEEETRDFEPTVQAEVAEPEPDNIEIPVETAAKADTVIVNEEIIIQDAVAEEPIPETDLKAEEEYRATLAAAEAVLAKASQVHTGAPMPKSAFRSWPRPETTLSNVVHEPQSPVTPVAKPEKKPKKGDVVSEIARQSVTENADLISETLADLLAAQQQYEKAIKMYERLILKFPKKSAYFASKIEKLKKK